ncbi:MULTISPECIES: Uma2 family endonuclease [Nostocales]|uniref:Uma2 family endonuclease n=3 Tax=Nostocales TaxID=1161 RepID=A0A0C1R3L8_9CYAN|nr:Uma2 family endonuclease [Tolypothrix bouteillei]KAF3889728.1 Uma2 family endonuclease [Tolypothrix bouteillei VB521301]
MAQAASKLLTYDEFITLYGDDDRYELIDGELVDMDPTGPHEQVAGFISRKLNVEIDRLDLPYFIPMRCIIKPLGNLSALRPDVVILDRSTLDSEPLWQREPVITLGTSVKMIVEVVSTNWQNDYARKVEDYEVLGISEYWIVDYLGIGGREYIGKPKQPTLTICQLVNGEYQKHLFRNGEPIISPTLSELKLTAEQIFAAAH